MKNINQGNDEEVTQTPGSLEGNKIHYNEVIKKLDLVPLPEEGGYYRETYRS